VEFTMATWTLKFGHGLFDFLHLRRPAAVRAPRTAAVTPRASRQVSERRAEAMRGFFPKLSAWLAHHSYLAEMSEVDRYLSQAGNILDLEQRIRRIERQAGVFRLD
jgi:hypothetical protein